MHVLFAPFLSSIVYPYFYISGDGALLSSGSNVYGQLGRARADLGLFPVEMSFSPVSIAAGLGHSLAICELIGRWCWDYKHCFMGMEPELSAWEARAWEPPSLD